MLLASALAGSTAPAAEPQPTPDIQTLMAMLNRLAAEAGVETAPALAVDEAAAAVPKTPAAPPAPAAPAPLSGSLHSGNLQPSRLAPSGALGGRGAAPAGRASEPDWRTLFPLKQPRN